MRIVVLGADGYIGWPTAMKLAADGHEVLAVDNYSRRNIARETCSEALVANPNLVDRAKVFEEVSGKTVHVQVGDCCDFRFMERIFTEFRPERVVHYAEQPAAPYGMNDYDQARYTLNNNLNATFNVIWAVIRHAPECQIVKVGTMGEYGTPNIDIEEGWLEVEHNGRRDTFLFPRAAGSLYHTTKVLDTDLLWFYCRTFGIMATDLMQGPVYGVSTAEADLDGRLMPNFHYDDIFGTVVNRFLVQAVAGVPLTVYGKGGQTRGYLDLRDTLQCVQLSLDNPVERGELRIMNTLVKTYSVNELAERVQRAGRSRGLDVQIQRIENPRKELEEHYYNPAHQKLFDLGLEPHPMTDEVLGGMLDRIIEHTSRIDSAKIMPRVRWS